MKIKVKKETQQKWADIPPMSYSVALNPNLIKSQNLEEKDIGKVFEVHGRKCFIFNKARNFLQEVAKKKFIDSKDMETIEEIKDSIEMLEFDAQKAWHFEENSNYHRWWLDIPGCECPVMDNLERVGVAGAIYTETCPWHGWFIKDKKEI